MFSMVCRPNSNRTECTSGTACLKVHRSNSCWLDRDQQTTEDEQEQATPDYDYSCAGPQRHSDGNLGWRRACQPTRPFEHKRHFHRVHINEDIARQFGSSQSFFFGQHQRYQESAGQVHQPKHVRQWTERIKCMQRDFSWVNSRGFHANIWDPDSIVLQTEGVLISDSKNLYDRLNTTIMALSGAEKRSDIETLCLKSHFQLVMWV